MKLLIKAILYPASLWIALLYFQGEKYPKEVTNHFVELTKKVKTVKSKPLDIEKAIKLSAELYGIDERLIDALIQQESSYRPQVVSHAGAIGLMQIMPATAKSVCEIYDSSLLFIPAVNIDCGTSILALHIQERGSKYDALREYNCGYPGLRGNWKACHKYAREVLRRLEV